MSTTAPAPRDTYISFTGPEITEDMIIEAAALFSRHYGIWSSGKRVRMSPERLRAELLPPGHEAQCSYVRAILDGHIYIGHAFACEWLSAGRPILWITQLVVHPRFRGHGIAKNMLKKLERPYIYGYGIVSSHAHAIMAATRAFGRKSEDAPEDAPACLRTVREHAAQARVQQSLKFIQEHAVKVMKRSPIRYIREAEVHGTLFGDVGDNVSTVDTKFLVDHSEPEEALQLVKKAGVQWALGTLPEGHEFLTFIRPRYSRRNV